MTSEPDAPARRRQPDAPARHFRADIFRDNFRAAGGNCSNPPPLQVSMRGWAWSSKQHHRMVGKYQRNAMREGEEREAQPRGFPNSQAERLSREASREAGGLR